MADFVKRFRTNRAIRNSSKERKVATNDEICPVCGQIDTSPAYLVPDHEYGLEVAGSYKDCSHCGSIFQFPMPNVETLSSFYPKDYHAAGPTVGFLFKLKYRQRLKSLEQLSLPKGAIVDYGCGSGTFLEALADHFPDRDIFGYEIAETNHIIERRARRIWIIKGDPDFFFANIPKVSAFTMNHVIEHLENPARILSEMFRMLSDGGCIVGQTPNADSLERFIFKRLWSGYHAPRHTVIFSQRGLEKLLSSQGWKNSKVNFAFNPAGIGVSLASITNPASGGQIQRKGVRWLIALGLATLLIPIDFFSGKPGIINFVSYK